MAPEQEKQLREEFENWLKLYPHLKGGNSFDTTNVSYGIKHDVEYASSWMQGTYEAFKFLVEKFNEEKRQKNERALESLSLVAKRVRGSDYDIYDEELETIKTALEAK